MNYEIVWAWVEYNCDVYYTNDDSNVSFYQEYLPSECNNYETEIYATYNIFGEDITFFSFLEFFDSSRNGMAVNIKVRAKNNNNEEVNKKLEQLYDENQSEFIKFKEFVINNLIQPLIDDFNENANVEYPDDDAASEVLYCDGKFYVELDKDFNARGVMTKKLQLYMPKEENIYFAFM